MKIKNCITTKEQEKIANKIGYKKVKRQKCHGQAIFTNGKDYISYDIDSHNGGVWKRAKTIADLGSRNRRMGTYSWDLKERIGD